MIVSINEDKLVNLYLDINPVTKKPFYVGIGNNQRIKYIKRNRYHSKIVESLPDQKFIRIVLYENIPLEKAWKIEKQIIKKCGRLIYKDGFLANIHSGGALPMQTKDDHWLKGKRIKDILPGYTNPREGKTYEEMYGDKKVDIIERQIRNRTESMKRRLEQFGKTEKEIEFHKRNSERRRNKKYTEKEIEAFKKTSQIQLNKTMKERLNNPNWEDPRKGKPAKEIYGEDYQGPPNKGKTYKQFKGEDYVLPTAKPFFIQIDEEELIFCESERFFCKIFNSNDVLLRKFKKTKDSGYIIKRQLNSKHYFPDKSLIKLFPCKIEDRPKTNINILNNIISKQKIIISDWILTKKR
jgi:hypothetical protein